MTFVDDYDYSEDVLDLPRGEIDIDATLDAFYYGDDPDYSPFDFGPDYGRDDLFDPLED